MKKSIAIFSLFALAVVFGAGDAFAADAVNKHNDADNNRAYASSDSSVKVDNELDADIDNDVEVDAETGENKAKGNSGDVFIWSGNATAGSLLTNNANNVLTSLDLGCGCNGAYAANINNGDDDRGRRHHRWGRHHRHHRGDDGKNTARATSDSSIEVENDLDADIDNDVEVDAETGENKAKNNGGEFNESVNRTSSESDYFNSYDEEETYSEGEDSDSSRSYRARRHHRWYPRHGSSSSHSSSSWSDWSYDNSQVTDSWSSSSSHNRSTSYPMGGNIEILTGDAQAGSDAETNVNLIQTFVSRGL
ncbi:MAG: hypothetical protein ACPGO5_03180 [Patescibacteria group bacterium]